MQKSYTPNWSGEIFGINIVKNTVSRTYVISNFNDGESTGTVCKKELLKTNQRI